MGNLRGWEWLIILLIILLLFGAKKLPEAARGLGRSLKIFKAETKDLGADDTPAQPEQPAPAPQPRAVEAPKPPATDPVVEPVAEPTAEPASEPSRRDA